MNYYDLAQTSLVKSPSSLQETYIPLWVCSNEFIGTGTERVIYISKGIGTTGTASVPVNLFTLSSSWSSSQKFAFEASILAGTGYNASASLYDLAGFTVVSIATVSTAFTVIRSNTFTLISGHSYGVSIYSASGSVLLSKAYLVAINS